MIKVNVAFVALLYCLHDGCFVDSHLICSHRSESQIDGPSDVSESSTKCLTWFHEQVHSAEDCSPPCTVAGHHH